MHGLQPFQVPFKDRVRLGTVLKALEIFFQFAWALFWEAVNHPVLMPMGHDEPVFLQIGKVLGNLDLRLIEQRLKMAHAKGSLGKQMKNSQARLIAEALINLD